MKSKFLIANWKSNMKYDDLEPYFKELNNCSKYGIDIKIAVPNIFLLESQKKSNFDIVAQDVEYFKYSSHTGRMSYEHLQDNSIHNVIIGHSEQRIYNDNTNEIINHKVRTLLKEDFRVILCIGEDYETYNNKKTIEFLYDQLENNLKNCDKLMLNNLIIAYEPIWSIGTNTIPSNLEISNIILKIKQKVNVPVLYGGSVNLTNIESLLNGTEGLDGFLIGSGSLVISDFCNMIKIVQDN